MSESEFLQQPQPETEKFKPLEIAAASVANPKHPDIPEDMHFTSDANSAGVFDGMGGLDNGDVAAQIARDYVNGEVAKLNEAAKTREPIILELMVGNALRGAHRKILENSDNNDMGTTATFTYIMEEKNGQRKAIIGNAGDSRVYLIRNGEIEQITLDDGIIRAEIPDEAQAREMQTKLSNTLDRGDLNEEEQQLYKKRNEISNYLGSRSMNPRVHTVDLKPGDRLVLCSDGIHDNLIDDEILSIATKPLDAESLAKQLVENAQKRSTEGLGRSKKDDITAIVIKEQGVNVKEPNKDNEVDKYVPKYRGRLKENDLVMIPKESGSIDGHENNWTIVGTTRDMLIVVEKVVNGRLTRKFYQPKELNSINNVASADEIPKVKSIDELADLLKHIDIIQGASQDFYGSDLSKLVVEVSKGNIAIDKVTRSNGLRDAVKRLLGRT